MPVALCGQPCDSELWGCVAAATRVRSCAAAACCVGSHRCQQHNAHDARGQSMAASGPCSCWVFARQLKPCCYCVCALQDLHLGGGRATGLVIGETAIPFRCAHAAAAGSHPTASTIQQQHALLSDSRRRQQQLSYAVQGEGWCWGGQLLCLCMWVLNSHAGVRHAHASAQQPPSPAAHIILANISSWQHHHRAHSCRPAANGRLLNRVHAHRTWRECRIHPLTLLVLCRCVMPIGAGFVVAYLQSWGFSPALKFLTRAIEGVVDDSKNAAYPTSYWQVCNCGYQHCLLLLLDSLWALHLVHGPSKGAAV